MHGPAPDALGPPQAIAVAWWVNGGQLGVSVHMCHQQHLMATLAFAAPIFTAATSAAALIDPQQSLAPMHPPSPARHSCCNTSYCAAAPRFELGQSQLRRCKLLLCGTVEATATVRELGEQLGGATTVAAQLQLQARGKNNTKWWRGGRDETFSCLDVPWRLTPTRQLRGQDGIGSSTCVFVRHSLRFQTDVPVTVIA